MTGVHCFVHVKDGIWSSLFEEPATHQEYIQHCNLYFGYLGGGIYVELIPRVETVQFQIFGMPEPVNIDVDAKPITIGTITSDEQDTLQSLLRTSQSPTSTVTCNMPIQTPSEPKAEPKATCSIDQSSFINKASCTPGM